MLTNRFYKKMSFIYKQDKSEFLFNYINKKFGHKESGYNVIVIDDEYRKCDLNIYIWKQNDVLKICEASGIEIV